MEKTNAIRALESKKASFEIREYDASLTNGMEVANALGEDPCAVFKTLVCEDPKHNHYVFCLPVMMELDLKAAAKVCGAKSIALIPQKELLPLTGYIHGGCSPFGMKKRFPTYVEETAMLFDHIYVSGGRKGIQLCIEPSLILEEMGATYGTFAH